MTRAQRLTGALRDGQVLLAVAVGVLVVDHVSKFAASLFADQSYVKNPEIQISWLLVGATAVLGLVVRSRLAVIGAGLSVGGSISNVLDSLVWPGGVPDFIRSPFLVHGTWNLADAAIWVGFPPLLALAIGKVAWLAGRRLIAEPEA